MAAAGAVLVLLLFTNGTFPPLVGAAQRRGQGLPQNNFDLCRITAMGNILSSLRGSTQISSHKMTRAWLAAIFYPTSLKYTIASLLVAKAHGPRSIMPPSCGGSMACLFLPVTPALHIPTMYWLLDGAALALPGTFCPHVDPAPS